VSNLVVCLNAVAPIFLIMALGYAVKRIGFIGKGDVPRLNKLIFRIFMPVMLFYSIYNSDLSTALQPRLLLFAFFGVLIEYFICLAVVVVREKIPARRGVMIQGLYRSNFVIIGIPLVQSLMGFDSDIGAVVMLITVVVPTFNVLAVVTLEMYNGTRPKISKLLLDILKNPLILGTAIGLLFLAFGIKLPAAIEDTVSQISNVVSPMLLFLLGVFFDFDGFRSNLKDLIFVTCGRLLVIPGIMLTAAYFLGFRGIEFAGLICIFGSANAIASFSMAQQMGGDAELAGDIVIATSALCPLTLFLWTYLFKSLGVY